MKKIKKIKKILAAVLLVALLIPLFPKKAEATVYPSGAIAVGIDVSIYQGDVDWNQVKNAGISFAMIKAYESGYGVDKKFVQNITGAAAAGLRTGVYVFSKARTVEEAYLEATTVVNLVAPYQVSFPIAIDLESKVMDGLSKDQIAAIANTFCAVIDAYGYTPIIYANKNWFKNRIGNVNYDRWVAMYADRCDYAIDPQMWQASSTFHVAGIKGNVDLDYLYKDYSYIVPNGFSTKGDGYVYLYKNYRYQRGWVDYAGLKFFCDAYGHLQTGWLVGAGTDKWYLGPDGYMRTGLQAIDGAIYYFGDDGLCKYGFQNIAGNTYYFDAVGRLVTNAFVPDANGGIHYFQADGSMAKGFAAANGSVYYFNNDGLMQVGLQKIGAQLYYFNGYGQMQTGWQSFPDGNKYFFDPANGTLYKGLLADVDGFRYCDPTDGHMVTGFVSLYGATFCFDPVTGLLWTNRIIPTETGSWGIDAAGVCTFYPGVF
ncbi:MAG: hypothetical protein MJ105_03130 [Lachnospiraceae bacterium]|nr:hypothetical protein [Lachnospiraceae bacterium]